MKTVLIASIFAFIFLTFNKATAQLGVGLSGSLRSTSSFSLPSSRPILESTTSTVNNTRERVKKVHTRTRSRTKDAAAGLGTTNVNAQSGITGTASVQQGETAVVSQNTGTEMEASADGLRGLTNTGSQLTSALTEKSRSTIDATKRETKNMKRENRKRKIRTEVQAGANAEATL